MGASPGQVPMCARPTTSSSLILKSNIMEPIVFGAVLGAPVYVTFHVPAKSAADAAAGMADARTATRIGFMVPPLYQKCTASPSVPERGQKMAARITMSESEQHRLFQKWFT